MFLNDKIVYSSMNDTAKTLNKIIDIFGFGCEFSPEELYNHFDNPKETIESLMECELIEKNQISDKYYLTDIFTCSSFLSQHLKEEETEEDESPEIRKYSYSIKKEDLIEFMAKFEGLEENIECIKIRSGDGTFKISAEIHADDDPIELPK